jgi:hypothetical protein
MADRLSIEDYLAHVGSCRGQSFGRRFRHQFRDSRGTAELAMLACPTDEEYAGFCRLVAVMSSREKEEPELLTDVQIRELAATAGSDPGAAAIFVNGYVLSRKKQINKDVI